MSTYEESSNDVVQGYLAHKKIPTPKGPPRTLQGYLIYKKTDLEETDRI